MNKMGISITTEYRMEVLLRRKKTCIFLLFYFWFGNLVAQNIGINVPNPIFPLDMSSNQCVARLTTTSSTYGSVLELRNTNSTGQYLGEINFNNAAGSYPGQIAYKANHTMSFIAGNQERMTIGSNGYIGIANQNPQYDIDIGGQQSIINLSGSDYYGSQLFFKNNDPEASFIGAIRFFNWGGNGGSLFIMPIITLNIMATGVELLQLARLAVWELIEIPGPISLRSRVMHQNQLPATGWPIQTHD